MSARDGVTQRTLTPDQRAGWAAYQEQRRRAAAERRNALTIVLSILLLLIGASLVSIISSKPAHAGGWGTLPADALQVCFVDNGQFECLNRVSDWDTLQFCPGTGDALHQPSAPGVILVGFTDGLTGVFTLVRQQAYQWRQYQSFEGRVVVGLDESVAGSFSDGFESCDEYRT